VLGRQFDLFAQLMTYHGIKAQKWLTYAVFDLFLRSYIISITISLSSQVHASPQPNTDQLCTSYRDIRKREVTPEHRPKRSAMQIPWLSDGQSRWRFDSVAVDLNPLQLALSALHTNGLRCPSAAQLTRRTTEKWASQVAFSRRR
jgi:hypothetical protein